MEYILPRSLAIVVESDVIGSTAVSVPAYPQDGGAEGVQMIGFFLTDVEAKLREEEARYRKDMKTGQHEVIIDISALRKAAEQRVLMGDRTWDMIGADCDWTREDDEYTDGRRGDGQKVRALLEGTRSLTYDEANALIKAIGVDPVDVGL